MTIDEARKRADIPRCVAQRLRAKHKPSDKVWHTYYLESDTPWGNCPYRAPRFKVKERPKWMQEVASIPTPLTIEEAIDLLYKMGASGRLDGKEIAVSREDEYWSRSGDWQDAMGALFDSNHTGEYHVSQIRYGCENEWQWTSDDEHWSSDPKYQGSIYGDAWHNEWVVFHLSK